MKKIFLLPLILSFLSCSEHSELSDSDHPFHPKWSKGSNIYEVNIRQYTPEGTFLAFQNHLLDQTS